MTEPTVATPAAGSDPKQLDVQKPGEIIVREPEPKKLYGPTFEERLAEVEAAHARGEDPFSIPTGAPTSAADVRNGEQEGAPEGGAEELAQPEGAPAGEGVDVALPEGFTQLENGQIKGPDGKFWSAEQVAQHLAGGAPEGAQAGAGEGASEQDGADTDADQGEPDESLIVRLPGRREGDGDVEVEVDDPEIAERFRQAINDGMRRAEFRRQMGEIESQRAELNEIYQWLEADPAGFLVDRIQSVDVKKEVAKHLMAIPEVYDAVVAEFEDVDGDERALAAKRNELELQRLKRRDQIERDVAQWRTTMENVRQVDAQLAALSDQIADEGRAQQFFRMAARELNDYAKQQRRLVDPDEVALILHRLGVLQLFGLRPGAPGPVQGRQDGGRSAEAPKAPADARPAARPQRGPAESAPAPVANTRNVAEQIRRAQAQRRAAAAVAPAGVGATPARVQPPPGQTVAERLKWAEKEWIR